MPLLIFQCPIRFRFLISSDQLFKTQRYSMHDKENLSCKTPEFEPRKWNQFVFILFYIKETTETLISLCNCCPINCNVATNAKVCSPLECRPPSVAPCLLAEWRLKHEDKKQCRPCLVLILLFKSRHRNPLLPQTQNQYIPC